MATHYSVPMKERAFRKNEGVVLVCQNNEDRSLLIYGTNGRTREITGFDAESLKGRDLTEIVPKDIRGAIEEHVEFKPGSRDLAAVLGKIRDFRLLDVEGEEVALRLRVAHAEARDAHYWYRLILRDEDYEREVEAFKRLMTENFKGHEVLDAESGLPDRNSLIKDMEFAHFCAKEKGFSSCIAVLRLDNYEALHRNFGHAPTVRMLQQVGENLKRNLRADDTVGRLGTDRLGIILMDITRESARIVLNRLRWPVASEASRVPDMSSHTMTVSVAFAMIGTNHPVKLIESCENALADNPSPNAMIENAAFL